VVPRGAADRARVLGDRFLTARAMLHGFLRDSGAVPSQVALGESRISRGGRSGGVAVPSGTRFPDSWLERSMHLVVGPELMAGGNTSLVVKAFI
jgi:hypothetical protein